MCFCASLSLKVPGRWCEEQLCAFFMWVTMAGSNEGIFQGRVMDLWHHSAAQAPLIPRHSRRDVCASQGVRALWGGEGGSLEAFLFPVN